MVALVEFATVWVVVVVEFVESVPVEFVNVVVVELTAVVWTEV